MQRFKQAVLLLEAGNDLPSSLRDHLLTGQWKGHRECHLAPDWLLIYRVDDDELTIIMVRLGSHSELFS